MRTPDVTPITHIDSVAGWLPTEMLVDSADFATLQSKVPSLSGGDASLRLRIQPDGRFDAHVPDEVLDRFANSTQDTLVSIAGTWRYVTDNHQNIGLQFTTSSNPPKTFNGYLKRRKGHLIMTIALGDIDSGNLLVLRPALP